MKAFWGGPAFPRPASEDRSQGDLTEGNRVVEEQRGMSLHDYYAAEALAPCIAQSFAIGKPSEPVEVMMARAASWARIAADAMLTTAEAQPDLATALSNLLKLFREIDAGENEADHPEFAAADEALKKVGRS